ncbi:hypothetical protein VI817_004587 [Penicillium citrinum]|nr:hypothetical protein VI817_004587 [Penicillium citrinum]
MRLATAEIRAWSITSRRDIQILKERHEQEKSNAVNDLIEQRNKFESEAKIQAQLYSNSRWDRADIERFTKDECDRKHEAKLNGVREFYEQQLNEIAERTRNENSNQIQLLTNDKEEKEHEMIAVKAEIVHLKEELTEAETEKRNHEEWKRMAGAEFWQLWRGCQKLERALKEGHDWTGSAGVFRCEGVDRDGDYEMDSPGPDYNITPTLNAKDTPTATMSVLEMENMNLNLRRQLVEHQSLTTELVKENKDLRGEIMKADADASWNMKTANDMLQANKNERDNLKSAVESLQSQNSKLATDHADLDRELGQLRIATQKSNEADLITRTDQIAAYESEIARLNQAIESQNEESLRASPSEASELRSQVDRLQSEKSEIAASNEAL